MKQVISQRLCLVVVVCMLLTVVTSVMFDQSKEKVFAASVIDSGTVGPGGAPWELFDNGTLEVGAGNINWTSATSPWYSHRNFIANITFTGPIEAGPSIANLFLELTNVLTIEGLYYFNTENVTDMSQMFRQTYLLTQLDFSGWNTASVTDMHNMFNGAGELASLDLSSWNVELVQDMNGLFLGTYSLEVLNLSGWNTESVTNMRWMFYNARSLTSLDLSSFDTSNVLDMAWMFAEAVSLEALDLIGFDTSSVEDFHMMFYRTTSLELLDLSSFYTSSAIDIGGMLEETINMWQLVLGADIQSLNSVNLPNVPSDAIFTGYWRNVAHGSARNPLGDYILTSTQLMAQYTGLMADTWVWERYIPEFFIIGRVVDIFGVPIAGATVTVRNPLGIIVDETTTCNLGLFSLGPFVGASHHDGYAVSVVATGFRGRIVDAERGSVDDDLGDIVLIRAESPSTPSPQVPPQTPPEELTPKTYFHKWFVEGYVDGNFRPAHTITRAEVAAILVRTMLYDEQASRPTTSLPFSDVMQENWFFRYIALAYEAGFIEGYPDSTFRPNNAITREELATLLARAGAMEILPAGDFSFIDSNTISSWARNYVYTLYHNGWMVGDDARHFNARLAITRAETPATFTRVLGRSTTNMDSIEGVWESLHLFPDVTSPASWYFFYVVEASHSHRFIKEGGTEIWVSVE